MANRNIEVNGLDEINKNLKIFIAQNRTGAYLGLIKSATFIQGEAQEITPQRKGVLVGSAFNDVDRGALVARIGYTAKYAPFVHEMPNDTNWTKPDTENKFLQKAIDRNFRAIVNMIAEKVRLTPKNYRGFPQT